MDIGNDTGVLALLDAFKRGVTHWFDRGEIGEDERDELIWNAELIAYGITLTA
jgi:hypothetical protein